MVQQSADEKIEELRKANREANETLADLKHTLKEARSLTDEIKKMIEDRCEEQVETAVSDSITKLQNATDRAIESSTDKIFERFDTLENLIFEGRRGKKKTGGESLESLVERKLMSE